MKDTSGNGKQLYLVFCFSDPDNAHIFFVKRLGRDMRPARPERRGELKPMGSRLQGKRRPLLALMNEHDADWLWARFCGRCYPLGNETRCRIDDAATWLMG